MEPVAPPVGSAACATWDPTRFASFNDQLAVFDGEPAQPERDILAARVICRSCSLLEDCRRFAYTSLDEHAFFAAETAAERRRKWRKSDKIAKRRRQAAELHQLGFSTSEMEKLLNRDERSIRNDLRAVRLQLPRSSSHSS
ncbi:WhiB family transcriptional regulator [Nocardia niwae]|uniref:WhiB family transcriptional regulator n=1 Tax=Nocardia niwae TaxID=626084 RepID=A0ABV2X5C6_9NOCA